MRRLLIIGKEGQLGWELQRTLIPLGEIIALDFPEINLENPDSIRLLIRDISPQIIINAAAYTNVDKAESEEEVVKKINAESPGIMAEEAKRLNAVFIHYSTDYVFDGKKESPYSELDLPNPKNIYGQTKLAGERNVQEVGGLYYIFRTSWVYSLRKGGFVLKVLEWAREKRDLHIVDDQFGSPTWARMLAEFTSQVISTSATNERMNVANTFGLYHLAGSGSCSRYEWAKKILELDPHRDNRIIKQLIPAKSSEFHTAAERPAYTSLDCSKFINTFNFNIPDWKISLSLAMNN